MKKTLIAATSLFALTAVAAFAADEPAKAPDAPAAATTAAAPASGVPADATAPATAAPAAGEVKKDEPAKQ